MKYAWLALAALLGFVPRILAGQPAVASRPIAVKTPAIELSGAPSTEFATDDINFHQIEAMVVRGDGSLVVANGGSLQLLIFDSAGTFVRAVGGKGAGPGEYQELWSLDLLTGDSLVILDRYQRRVTVLAPDGKYARSFNIAPPFDGGGSPHRLVALRSGDLLIGYSEVRTMPPSPVAQQFRERLFVYRASGEVVPGAGISLLGSEHFTQAVPMRYGGVAYWSRTFGRLLTIRAVQGGFAAGDGTDWSVNVHQLPGGTVAQRHSVAREVVRVTPAAIARERQDHQSRARPDRLELFEKMFDEMPYPETMPAYQRFEVDEHERLWIEAYAPASARPRRALWVRVDPKSREALLVRFPDRFQPMAFAHGHVFGIWRDEDDVQHVRGYDLTDLR